MKFSLGFNSIFFFFLFFFYVFFLSKSVFGGDSGDFLAAIAVRGVPHPSGYPLYVLFGILLSFLPIDATLAWKVGIGSAFFSTITVMFVYLTVLRLWKNRMYALIASLTLAFTFPFWLYAEITEVMSLQHFFIVVILYFSILYRETRYVKHLYLIALFYGLSLTNNQTMLLFLPVVFILVIKTMYKSKSFFKKLLYCIAFFVLGLLPYIYLPIAASFHPPVNWNNPVTLQAFLKLVLRQDYGWIPKIIVDNSVKLLILKRYLHYLFSELTFLGVFLIGIGIVPILWQKKQRLISLAFFLGFFLFGPFFFYYGAGPAFDQFSDGAREKFYTSSLLFLILFLPFGIEAVILFSGKLLRKIGADNQRIILYKKGITLFFLLLPLILFIKNVKILDLRDSTRITEVFSEELLTSLPKNTVVIAQHDNVLFSVWYMEYAKGVRSDVYTTLPGEMKALAERGMVRLNPNPITTALRNDTDPDNDVHNIALQLPTSVVISESDYHSFVKDNKVILFPYGLVLKYADASEREMSKESFLEKQNVRLKKLSNPNSLLSQEKKERLWLLSNFPLFYAHAYTNTGYFLMYAYNDYPQARKYFKKAISIDDQDHWGYEGLGISYYQQKQYKKARDAFRQAVIIQPLNYNAYFLLYKSYLALKDKEESSEVEKFFKKYSEIYTEFKFEKTKVKLPR